MGFGPGSPPGYQTFDRHAPAFGGAAGYMQVIAPDGEIVRPGREEPGPALPVTPQAFAVARNGVGTRFDDQHAAGTHVRVLTIGLGRLGAVQVARPLTEVDNSLHKVLLIMLAMIAGGIALA